MVCCMVVVSGTHSNVYRIITSLGSLWGCEQEAFFSTTCMLVVETSQRNVYTDQVAVQLPGSMVSSVTIHEGLTMPSLDWARGPQMPTWIVRAQGLSCPRLDHLFMPTQTGQRMPPVPGGPHQPLRRQHLGAGRSLHSVLYKSTHVHWVPCCLGCAGTWGCPGRVGPASTLPR